MPIPIMYAGETNYTKPMTYAAFGNIFDGVILLGGWLCIRGYFIYNKGEAVTNRGDDFGDQSGSVIDRRGSNLSSNPTFGKYKH